LLAKEQARKKHQGNIEIRLMVSTRIMISLHRPFPEIQRKRFDNLVSIIVAMAVVDDSRFRGNHGPQSAE
jgi:hypothetical protein